MNFGVRNDGEILGQQIEDRTIRMYCLTTAIKDCRTDEDKREYQGKRQNKSID